MDKKGKTNTEAKATRRPKEPAWVRSEKAFDRLRLIDSFFFEECFQDVRALGRLLSIILSVPDIEVLRVEREKAIESFGKHSVRLDIYAVDKKGNVYDVELQNQNRHNEAKRAAFYASALTSDSLGKRRNYKRLPGRYVVFLTSFDPFGKGYPVYHFDTYDRDGGTPLGDGGHVYFFVTKYKGEDETYASLARDLRATSYEKIHDAELARVMWYNKNERRARSLMIERYGREYNQIVRYGKALGREEGVQIGEKSKAEEIAKNLLSLGLPTEDISKSTGLSPERVEELKKQA